MVESNDLVWTKRHTEAIERYERDLAAGLEKEDSSVNITKMSELLDI